MLVPFEMGNGILKIAIADASKLSLMKNLKTMTQLEPELYAASISDISGDLNINEATMPKKYLTKT